MNKITGHFGDKFPIYLLLFTIGSLLLYYSLGYIPQNQQRLDDYGVRVLENKARAISDKYRGYDNAVSSAPRSYLSKWYFNLHPEKTEFFLDDTSHDTVVFSGTKAAGYAQITQHDFTAKGRVDQTLVPTSYQPKSEDGISRIWKEDKGSCYFIYTPATAFYNDVRKTNNRIFPLLRLNIADFTANLKENDFYEDLFLIRAHKCRKCDKTKTDDENFGYGNFVLDQSNLGLVEFNLADTAKNASSGIYEERIFGKQYKVYYQMIKLRRDVDVYLVGLIPLDNFKSQSKKVSVWFLVFCSLAALLLIFSFPVLKLFLLSKHESLATKDISLGVFSVMLCACLCVIVSIGYYLFWGLETDAHDDQIKVLAKGIKSKVSLEVTTLRAAIQDTSLFHKESINMLTVVDYFHTIDYNEIFLLDTLGYMKAFTTQKGKDPDLKQFPVNVSERNYFKEIRTNPNNDYFVQMYSSFASGKSEVAISVPVTENGHDYVGVITSPLKAILQADIAEPFHFVMLDNLGDVKFHSDWNHVRSENFIRELENTNLITGYLQNGVTDYVDFTYLQHECRGYIIPVVKNWSLLVYYERGGIYNMSAQIFVLSLASLFIAVLFCMGIHAVFRGDRKKIYLLKTRPFLFDWLNPLQAQPRKWKLLIATNCILFVAEATGLYYSTSFLTSLLFTLIIIATSYLTAYHLLKNGNSWMPDCVLITTIIVFTVLLILIETDIGFGAFMITGCIIIYVFSETQKPGQPSEPDTFKLRSSQFTLYRGFMMSWLMVIILGPSVGFLIRHFEHETLMTSYAKLIADVQKQRVHWNQDPHLKMREFYAPATTKTPQNIKDTLSSCTYFDSVYYNQFPKITTLNRGSSPLQFSYVPLMADVKVANLGELLSVTSNTNALGVKIDRTIEVMADVNQARLIFNRSLAMTIVLLAGLGILLWYVITTITRKVFYLPQHNACTDDHVASGEWGTIDREFISGEELAGFLNENNIAINESWDHESAILCHQLRNEDRYKSILSTCSEDEKFFLFDLADDGVVNRNDDEHVIRSLTKKKLIRLFPTLEFTNISFANFVKEHYHEYRDTNNEIVSDGRWKQTRILIIIIILAVFAFLSFAEESFFGRAAAIIGSVTLILPNIISIFGSITKLFGKGQSGQ